MSRRRSALRRSLALAGLLTVGAAAAQQGGSESPAAAPLVPGAIQRLVMEAAGKMGSVRLSTDDDGPFFLIAESHGLNYGISFAGCDARGDLCKSMRLASYWDPYPDSDLDTWNRTKYVGRAYSDADGTTLDLWVSLEGGLSAAQLAAVLDWWDTALQDFAGYLWELE